MYYTHDEVGYNYRMTNIQAALGLAQLEQLEDFIKSKKSNYIHYHAKLESISGLSLIPFRKETRPNYWFYGMVISDEYSYTRNELIEKLAIEGIQSRPIWDLIHQQKPYKEKQAYQINYSTKLLNHVINIPCSSNLTEEEINRVINTLEG